MLDRLLTEAVNPATADIDTRSSLEIVQLINAEDAKVAAAIALELPHIAEAVDIIVARLQAGGHLYYFGAGTSGRLGVLDASEMPPTYNTPPELVRGVICGGTRALTSSVERMEDDELAGERDVTEAGVSQRDVAVGIAASGRTPYVIGALRKARSLGAATVALSCHTPSLLGVLADVEIAPLVGPEVVAGSTRMKAGTAQKMVLNMLSTATMIRLGKTYGNLMVDVRGTNSKLVDRARRIVQRVTGVSGDEAVAALDAANGEVKVALVMLLAKVGAPEARTRLAHAGGLVRKAIGE
jgi:N-acetylmuramic acid 6-phosphate etherase